MKILLTHPGTQYSHRLAVQLAKRNLLYQFHTCFAIAKKGRIHSFLNLIGNLWQKKLSNRIIPALEPNQLKTYSFLELRANRKIKKGIATEAVFYERNRRFQEMIPNSIIQNADIVIGFDSSSWILVEKCKELGKKFILDVSIGHPISKREIYNNLQQKYPEWRDELSYKSAELIAIEQYEIENADLIVVPSKFVKDTYINNGVDQNKIYINPFGTDLSFFEFEEKKVDLTLKFLFYGGLTARKGLPLLLETWQKANFSNAELIIAGFGDLPTSVQLPENVKNFGKIHAMERKALFSSAHVFVFPSFFEGFAQVLIEACASGLPIISTPNAGAEEIIVNNINGLLIPTGSTLKLEETMRQFIDNPNLVHQMSLNQKAVSEKFSWDAYGERWENIVKELI